MAIELSSIMRAITESLVFSAVGLVAFIVSFYLVERIVPFSVRKEIEEDQNVAVGVVLGAMFIGIAMIIAAAIAG